MLIEELIEKAFCEGYKYAQKEYARRDYEGLSEKAANKLREDRKKIADWTKEQRKKGIKTINRGKQVKTRVEVESPSGVYKKSTTNWWKPGTDIESIEKASRNSMLKDAIKVEKEHLKNKADWNDAFSAEKIKDAFNEKKSGKGLSKRDLAILGGSAAALASGAIAYKKYKSNKKQKEQEDKENKK